MSAKRPSGEISPELGILGAYAVLALLGLYCVASSSYVYAGKHNASPYYYARQHACWLMIAAAVFAGSLRIRLRAWRSAAYVLLGGALVLSALVFVPGLGVTAGGATRRLRLGPGGGVQPAEFLKLGLALAMAAWLTRPRRNVRRVWPDIAVAVGMMAVCALTVMKQRDLGTTLVLLGVGSSVLFAAGTPGYLLSWLGAGMASCAALAVVAEPYRWERVLAWLEPWKYKGDESYQVVQSFYAFGEGAWHGTGVGAGQAKYYLPAPHTDFVCATIAEETGIIGAAVILGLFLTVAYWGIKIARRSPNPFGRLAAIGAVAGLCGQAALNIAVVTGALPCTGVPLPFISYGGSSLVVSSLCLALLFSISRTKSANAQEDRDEGGGDWRRDRGAHIPRTGRGSGSSRGRARSATPVRR